MKKSIVALLLSVVCVFGGCNLSELMSGGNSTSNSTNSSTENTSNSETNGDENDSTDNGGDIEYIEEHTDEDNDEMCDDCGISVVTTVDFFTINDLHGKFADSDMQPGVDELTTYLKNAKAENENTIFLSSGDMWQGSSESNFTKGLIVTDWMSEVGFSSMTLGNHEYDWGEEYVKNNAAIANFPFLAINIYDEATNERVDYCQPSVLVKSGAVNVGIIGAIGDCYSSISGDKVEDIYFKTGTQLTSLVKEEANKLRAQGADFIVYSIHDGYDSSKTGSISDSQLSSYYDISLSNYVDLVFEGHTHQKYTNIDKYGVYHIQAGGENDGLSHVEIGVNSVTGKKKVTDIKVIKNTEYKNLADHAQTEALEDRYRDIIDRAYAEVGKVSTQMSDSEIEDLVAQLYLEAGQARWKDQYQIVLGGGMLKTRAPYDLSAGNKTYADLFSILPFNNRLALCSISGYNLKNRFINTSNSDYHIALSDYGKSISIENNATYYVIVDTYTALYAPNRLTEIARYEEQVFARDLLAEYVKKGGLK